MQEAAAAAPAPEVVPETPPEADLGALYDKLTSDETPKVEEPAEAAPNELVEGAEATETPVDTVKEVKEVIEAPSELPPEVREAWGDIAEGARDAITKSHREFNRMLSEQGRQLHGIKPIQDSLVKAVKELPHLADMKPDQVANQVFELAKVSAQFAQDPVKALMGYIDKHGLKEQMGQALAGHPLQGGETIQRLNNHIQTLERKIQQFEDPDFMRSQVSAITSEQSTMSEVTAFAKSAVHWGKVEDHLPHFVALERQMQPEASPQDVLKAAYEAAVSRFVPEARKASEEAISEASEPAQPDPEKTKAALKAKSVNVRSQPSTKTRTLSEREELAAVYDRMQD